MNKILKISTSDRNVCFQERKKLKMGGFHHCSSKTVDFGGALKVPKIEQNYIYNFKDFFLEWGPTFMLF